MNETTAAEKGKFRTAFEAVENFSKNHKKLTVVCVVALMLVAVLAFNAMGSMQNTVSAVGAGQQTLTLTRMDLEQIVSATGTLQSSSTQNVTSTLAYEVATIYVQEGDWVEAGTLLAQLDTTALDKEIATIRANIKTAEEDDALSLSQAKRKLQDAINAREINRAANATAVQNALDALEAAVGPANIAVSNAQTALDAAQAALDADPTNPTLQNDLANAQSGLVAAQIAQSNAVTAAAPLQAAYEQAVATRDANERNDSINVENLQDAVNTQTRRDSAASYRTQLSTYLENRQDCRITAPIAGTVTAIGAKVGQSAAGSAAGASSGALFTVEDTNRLEITATIPEYDAVLLQAGMHVSITSDAISGTTWQGILRKVSPKAVDSNGNFSVLIEVSSPVGDLAIGMSAKVNIVIDSQPAVFAVPYDALTTNEAGQSIIYVLDIQPPSDISGGAVEGASIGNVNQGENALPQGRPVVVTTGMETDYYIEISSSELYEGMLVLADPEGRNVSTGSDLNGIMMGGRF
ncbi:efflux RND transporter periplasmic adaptor subunit [Ruminococcaceae bacterium OttesenSCG-928-N02]|nr:efflux RND transporter periplasmic adaptor subunit [Ruminococcaceae bacterium OttesenSCG-928-N02]